MPTNHDAKLAFPITSPASQTEARNLTVKRMAYVVTAASEVPNLVAVDPNTGAIIQVITCLGRNYLFDAADTTSVHDGTTVLVSNEGKRYKLATQNDMVIFSVNDKTHTAPPVSPSPIIGDAYLVATGGTGAFAGHDGQIGVFTARGWEFVIIAIGQFIYDESTDTYWHKNAAGTLVSGFGSQTLSDDTVKVSNIIGKPVRWNVQNQTTNTPPVSPAPSIGDAYIVGSTPTGAWAGHAGKIAILEVIGTWSIYAPRDGELAYDNSLNSDYRYDLATTTWISSAGAIVGTPVVQFTATNGSTTTGGTGSAAYSSTVAPTTSLSYREDSVTITYTARRSGARLRFFYQYISADSVDHVLGLFRDSEANAVDWVNTPAANSNEQNLVVFEVTTADATSHTYKIRLVNSGGGTPGAPTRRRFTVEEFA